MTFAPKTCVWARWYFCVDVRNQFRKAEPLDPRPSSSVWGKYIKYIYIYVRYMVLSTHLATFPTRGPSLLSQAPIMCSCCWSSHANITYTRAVYPRWSLINNLHGCQDQILLSTNESILNIYALHIYKYSILSVIIKSKIHNSDKIHAYFIYTRMYILRYYNII